MPGSSDITLHLGLYDLNIKCNVYNLVLSDITAYGFPAAFCSVFNCTYLISALFRTLNVPVRHCSRWKQIMVLGWHHITVNRLFVRYCISKFAHSTDIVLFQNLWKRQKDIFVSVLGLEQNGRHHAMHFLENSVLTLSLNFHWNLLLVVWLTVSQHRLR